MSDIDLAGIRRRQERGVHYWQLRHPEWAGVQEAEIASHARAAYLGVIRDIPALLEELERVTAQRDEAWKQLDLGDTP
jgi:hypothetical protein